MATKWVRFGRTHCLRDRSLCYVSLLVWRQKTPSIKMKQVLHTGLIVPNRLRFGFVRRDVAITGSWLLTHSIVVSSESIALA